MANVIVISNQKGGVGKTTTAVNLSASIAAMEKKVLLVDLDPQGNASQGVGYYEVQDEDIYEVLEMAKNNDSIKPEELKGIIKPTSLKFLNVIPSSSSLAAIEMSLVGEEHREYRLRNAISGLRKQYEYIIIDSPPSLNLLTLNALTAADLVIIPVQCEYYALQGLAELFTTIRLVQKNFNPDLEIAGALLTMYDSRLKLSKMVADDVKSCFSDTTFETIIPRNVILGEAPSYGKPAILYDVQSTGAQAYMNLAKELINNGN